MNLYLNDILHLSSEEVENSKIELNQRAGTNGENFIDRYLQYEQEDKVEGLCKNCSYWSGSDKKVNFKPGNMVFSFIKITGDEWILVSAAKINKVKRNDWADVVIIDKYKPLFGKLIVKFSKSRGTYGYVFNFSTYHEKIVVKEILPCIYDGEKFEGYDKINLPFSKLSDIFNGKILPTYTEALSKIKGVYCLTDKDTGKLYIGSATGEEGVYQRWYNYFSSKHGGNKKLIKLYKNKGSEYFEKNFSFTLIEYFNLSYDDEKIKERERYWKRCFDTVKNGYNDNY